MIASLRPSAQLSASSLVWKGQLLGVEAVGEAMHPDLSQPGLGLQPNAGFGEPGLRADFVRGRANTAAPVLERIWLVTSVSNCIESTCDFCGIPGCASGVPTVALAVSAHSSSNVCAKRPQIAP